MNVYFVVNHRRDWPFETPGATVITARELLQRETLSEPAVAAIARRLAERANAVADDKDRDTRSTPARAT